MDEIKDINCVKKNMKFVYFLALASGKLLEDSILKSRTLNSIRFYSFFLRFWDFLAARDNVYRPEPLSIDSLLNDEAPENL